MPINDDLTSRLWVNCRGLRDAYQRIKELDAAERSMVSDPFRADTSEQREGRRTNRNERAQRMDDIYAATASIAAIVDAADAP